MRRELDRELLPGALQNGEIKWPNEDFSQSEKHRLRFIGSDQEIRLSIAERIIGESIMLAQLHGLRKDVSFFMSNNSDLLVGYRSVGALIVNNEAFIKMNEVEDAILPPTNDQIESNRLYRLFQDEPSGVSYLKNYMIAHFPMGMEGKKNLRRGFDAGIYRYEGLYNSVMGRGYIIAGDKDGA